MSSHLTNSKPSHLPKLSPAINEGVDFHKALAIALSQVCEVAGWEYGEAWIPSEERTILELSPAWYQNTDEKKAFSLNIEQFRLCTEGFIFPPAVGLPGRIWSSQKPEWICDASALSETFFLRNQIAKAFGIKAGYGVPIFHQQEVKAIIIFFTCKNCQEDRQLTELAQAAAVELGKFFA